jgi:hypothetical protein
MEKNMKYILDNKLPEEYINEREVLDEIAAKYVDSSLIYSYQADWRMSLIECAAELDRLIIKHIPTSPDEALHPDFIKALLGLASAEYNLSIAEGELFSYEMRKVCRQNDCR